VKQQTNPKKQQQTHRIDTGSGPADALGDVGLLARSKLALISSQKCPGDVILKTYDFARLVRGSWVAIVSGFHSPIEKDCLPILLRGPDPIIIVQAHRLSTSRLPKDWQKALEDKRLLLLSPFVVSARPGRIVAAVSDRRRRSEIDATTAVSDRRRRSEIDATTAVSDRRRRSETAATVPNTAKRVTAQLAAERNRFVAAISDEVLIPFAAPGSKTEALALDLLASGKPVYTFGDRPGPLLSAGARLIPADFFSAKPAAPK
jgi:predicted Rossmann fold nucleotide-binding protein DprA/Smf involved in DNA uptake